MSRLIAADGSGDAVYHALPRAGMVAATSCVVARHVCRCGMYHPWLHGEVEQQEAAVAVSSSTTPWPKIGGGHGVVLQTW